jgi:hypothetical protein
MQFIELIYYDKNDGCIASSVNGNHLFYPYHFIPFMLEVSSGLRFAQVALVFGVPTVLKFLTSKYAC